MPGPQIDLAWFQDAIRNFLDTSPHNRLWPDQPEKAWEDFLVGLVAGDDELWELYKQEYVGPFHYRPEELFNLHFPDQPAVPDELTVISYILPQSQATRRDNRVAEGHPAERWARARIFGEEANKQLRAHLVDSLAAAGVDAVAPLLSPHWKIEKSDKYFLASRWSERHAAYAAGLGTFGLCDGLITAKGKAIRAGSLVARVRLAPTPRPYDDHHAYCLFYTEGTCGKCIERCPVQALSEAGHDKPRCKDFLRQYTTDYVKQNYGFDGYGCGLCQTKVPCEAGIPVRSKR
jgi:epoxyqueuosine reductase QueG